MHEAEPARKDTQTTDRRSVPGRQRVVIDRVFPEINGGHFPIKRTPGEQVTVRADMFADGHDVLAGVVKYRHVSPDGDVAPWMEANLVGSGNDSWTASFPVSALGRYEYTVEGWIDRFGTWLGALVAKSDAGQDVKTELVEGALLIQEAAARMKPSSGRGDSSDGTGLREQAASDTATSRPEAVDDSLLLLEFADLLRRRLPQKVRVAAARDRTLAILMAKRHDRSHATAYDHVLEVQVDPELARFSAWYEMFPRSCTSDPTRSGTFREAEERLPDIAAMGFDVLYLPPIHPIGQTHRKGPNNALVMRAGDPGSPWAIGARTGGHTAVEPGLGTLEDFDRFVGMAARLGLKVALDIAFQTSPDHPWVTEHPEWFRRRPDGSIKHAENPPKKYQDIYPFDFESEAWESLWSALRDVFLFWIRHGVRVFRVDNPHTKPLHFWRWVTHEIRRNHPDVIFLSEAFTRPKVMHYLAKVGFSQSYTYFTWKNRADELGAYVRELTQTEVAEFMRPNFFTNTPDILHEYLQHGGRPAFEVRLILAAMLAASYGIYSGYELCENVPVRSGSEEYLDSEKYQIKPRNWAHPGSLRELIARINEIRHTFPALQHNTGLAFHATDNGAFLFFSKRDPERTGPGSRVFVIANTDPHWMQHGWVQMPVWELGLSPRDTYTVEDLLDGARYTWHGEWNYVKLDPAERVAHILVIHR